MLLQISRRFLGVKGSIGIFVGFMIAYLAVISIVGMKQPAWGDEEHFVQTIHQFGQGITLDLLRTYDEMSTPLPFILYSVWGKLFGFELPVLRIFSIVIALATSILYWWLCYKTFHNAFNASVCVIFLFLNPYMVGFSLFVFPDMLAIFFLITGLLALIYEKPIILGIACACGLLSRQYFVFFPMAIIFYSMYKFWLKDTRPLKMLIVVLLGTIPTLLLFWLWKGASPQNSLRDLYLGYAFKFSPTALVLYIILLGAYLAPLVIIRWRKYYTSLGIVIISLLIGNIYWLFPIKASAPSLNNGIDTVGYLHRLLSAILGHYANLALFVLFVFSLPILIHIIKAWVKDFKQPGFDWILKLTILLFLVVMPFSYLWWEKYFVLILPVAILEIYLPVSKTLV